jgi:HAMP domain-containing protein
MRTSARSASAVTTNTAADFLFKVVLLTFSWAWRSSPLSALKIGSDFESGDPHGGDPTARVADEVRESTARVGGFRKESVRVGARSRALCGHPAALLGQDVAEIFDELSGGGPPPSSLSQLQARRRRERARGLLPPRAPLGARRRPPVRGCGRRASLAPAGCASRRSSG